MADDVRIGLVPMSRIQVHPHNVRRDLGDLRSLVESIKEHGLLQPIVVERRGEMLRIRAGHRRFAAADLAGLTRIPAVVHGDALDDVAWLRAAVAENAIRRDMEVIERVDAADAMASRGMKAAAIAAAFGTTPTEVRRWRRQAAALRSQRPAGTDSPGRRPNTPPRLVSVKKVRTVLAEVRTAVQAGDLDAMQALAAVEAVLPDEPPALAAMTDPTPKEDQ